MGAWKGVASVHAERSPVSSTPQFGSLIHILEMKKNTNAEAGSCGEATVDFLPVSAE